MLPSGQIAGAMNFSLVHSPIFGTAKDKQPGPIRVCSTAESIRLCVDPEPTAKAVATTVTAVVLVFINQVHMEVSQLS